MSNAKTRRIFASLQQSWNGMPLVTAEELDDGTALERPIYFREFRNGCYLSTDAAIQIARDLLAAAAKAGAKS